MKVIHEELHYAQSPDLVFALISTGAFQVDVIAYLGGTDVELLDETLGADGSVKVVTRQRTGIELPGFAKKLIPANTTVTQTYEWGPAEEGGRRRGTWAADTKGAPVSLGGPTELRADGSGSVHVYDGEVRASIPLVGGRLESFALDNLRRELGRTAEFASSKLADS